MPWAPTSNAESLVSVADYLAWYGLGTPSTDVQTQIQMAVDMASAEVRAYTDQFLSQQTETISLRPLSGVSGQIVLPQYPVTAVPAITVEGQALTENIDYAWSDRGVVTFRGSVCIGWVTGLPPLVTITYTHGYNPLPADIAEIVLGSAKRYIDAPSDQVVESETLGSWSVKYSTVADGLSPTEKLKLDRYAAWTVGY